MGGGRIPSIGMSVTSRVVPGIKVVTPRSLRLGRSTGRWWEMSYIFLHMYTYHGKIWKIRFNQTRKISKSLKPRETWGPFCINTNGVTNR